MENMNHVVMYEKPFKEQIKNNKTSKLIKKAIIGLTLAAGLTFTACGSTEYVNHTDSSVIVNRTYEDLANTYTSVYKMELTPNDAAGLREINEWFVESDKIEGYDIYTMNKNNEYIGEDDFDFFGAVSGWGGDITSLWEKDLNAVNLINNTIIEDMLNANNLLKEITELKAEDCSIETEITDKGITYYAQIRSYNAFEDSETYYRSKITDEGLIQILDIVTNAKANRITDEEYNKFKTLVNEYESTRYDLKSDEKKPQFYKRYLEADFNSVVHNIVAQGDKLHTALYNAIHNQYKFNKWNIVDNTIDMSKTR